nr:unnamed protein product [Callosobruchus chinensis]
MFPNLTIALRAMLSLPVTVASGERTCGTQCIYGSWKFGYNCICISLTVNITMAYRSEKYDAVNPEINRVLGNQANSNLPMAINFVI